MQCHCEAQERRENRQTYRLHDHVEMLKRWARARGHRSTCPCAAHDVDEDCDGCNCGLRDAMLGPQD